MRCRSCPGWLRLLKRALAKKRRDEAKLDFDARRLKDDVRVLWAFQIGLFSDSEGRGSVASL